MGTGTYHWNRYVPLEQVRTIGTGTYQLFGTYQLLYEWNRYVPKLQVHTKVTGAYQVTDVSQSYRRVPKLQDFCMSGTGTYQSYRYVPKLQVHTKTKGAYQVTGMYQSYRYVPKLQARTYGTGTYPFAA